MKEIASSVDKPLFVFVFGNTSYPASSSASPPPLVPSGECTRGEAGLPALVAGRARGGVAGAGVRPLTILDTMFRHIRPNPLLPSFGVLSNVCL